ncbi:MAG: Holliday junction resolvase RuvX [Actinomycetota bacterium]
MRFLGLDIGGRRIGVAVSDPGGITAQPLTVIIRETDDQAVADIVKLAVEYEAEEIVYGVPMEADGDYGKQAELTQDFAYKLKAAGLNVKGHDERFSTAEAERVLIDQDVSRMKRREVVDKIAASIILQGYLDRRNG